MGRLPSRPGKRARKRGFSVAPPVVWKLGPAEGVGPGALEELDEESPPDDDELRPEEELDDNDELDDDNALDEDDESAGDDELDDDELDEALASTPLDVATVTTSLPAV